MSSTIHASDGGSIVGRTVGRTLARLSARGAASIATPGYHADGGGLYLQVTATGARSWIFRFTLRGRAREMGLGPLQLVPLADARREALECRVMLHDGKDPIEVRRADLAHARRAGQSVVAFTSCAEAYIAAHKSGWRNAKHADQWTATLRTYAFPTIGELAVEAVDTSAVLKVVEPIWTTRTETASRVRGRIEAILDWAKARGLRNGDNPARWRGHLDHLLPPRSRVRSVVHHPALPYQDLPTFMAELRTQDGIAARGLELQILTASRTGEVIGSRWEEFDIDRRVWTVPATRMKAHREHRVALSSAVVDLLTQLREISTSDFVLPGLRPLRPLSNMAFLAVLKRMGRTDLTAHGFRSTFRDWAAEQTSYPSEVAEMALAHTISDKVEAAYRRGDLFAKRVGLMEEWASFCSSHSSEMVGPG